MKELGTPTAANVRLLTNERLALLRECSARYDVDRMPVEELPPVIELFIEAQQPELAQKARISPRRSARSGNVRLVMIGYDDANEEKIAAFIAKLLAESSQ